MVARPRIRPISSRHESRNARPNPILLPLHRTQPPPPHLHATVALPKLCRRHRPPQSPHLSCGGRRKVPPLVSEEGARPCFSTASSDEASVSPPNAGASAGILLPAEQVAVPHPARLPVTSRRRRHSHHRRCSRQHPPAPSSLRRQICSRSDPARPPPPPSKDLACGGPLLGARRHGEIPVWTRRRQRRRRSSPSSSSSYAALPSSPRRAPSPWVVPIAIPSWSRDSDRRPRPRAGDTDVPIFPILLGIRFRFTGT
ncbi:hypothetical protein PVAP13_7NG131100 [Panicum virgatum]|uniref:Uncharacterized protein n=1 Tax=Panicum virgatum TaxID=38727 RepID=A0A8T0Q4N1_PANVG|nr:hypothetical protein PVAP13_7NG131100 [Panicum virgatum]KAG2566015.1 hypothetical protein PVAP13_7NG131100 [Panicum virgatum]KAG2566016.1 hypothetical protein PVAP13_7NG131100 [Panicum virgatum]KAG2566017.1 hypothetical protein PVAP13_7NG131100 [Panicum virgatum]